ncbi:thermosome subunit [Candidatus Pacearchaeota archaeon CG10_big_fil_rev_8_21_14_0_10_35_13]|nr:MAG: thermosome subunit [Candidatus Pacearchaeota archaeon CG10_big_fil_rev_8_21_14_0_10_35_13]
MSRDNYVLPENSNRTMGRDAQRNNIMAAKIVADMIKTTLGPKGMDKMLVSSSGDITITNDGVTILEEMEVEHPAAKMMVEIARTQEKEVGDGTTTAVMLAGRLLENAEELLDNRIHPTTIIKGYRKATEKAQEILKELSQTITTNNDEILRSIVKTSITGKGAEPIKEKLSEIIVKAVKQVAENNKADMNNIKIVKVRGGSMEDTELIEGIVLDKERVNNDMPQIVREARIALVDVPLEIKGPETETRITINNPEQLQGFIDREDRILKGIVEKIQMSGANVIFCQKGIDDIAQYYLTKAGIYACRRITKNDMEKLSRATKGKIISNINEITTELLGRAEIVEEIKEGEEIMTYVRGCKNPKAITIMIRGGTEHVIDEVERAMVDGLSVVSSALKEGMIVAGGGAIEIELSRRLRQYSQTFPGRERLAIERFSEALEQIPFTLAENAGLDPIDTITELKTAHDQGRRNHGLNLLTGRIEDNLQAGIIEPTKVKSQAISSASEVATMILRIDDVIAANDNKKGMRPEAFEHLD